MKKLLLLPLLVFAINVIAQINFCGSEFDGPEIEYPASLRSIDGDEFDYQVPVVFHVLQKSDNDLLTDVQITDVFDAAQALFDGDHFTHSSISLCLAVQDPEGNVIPGDPINRVSCWNGEIVDNYCNAGTYIPLSIYNDYTKASSVWPIEDYLNIWIVDEIDGALGVGLPWWLTYIQFNGVVISKDLILGDHNEVLVHEIGHYFGLFHTFEGECGSNDPCVGDRVCDTDTHTRPIGDPLSDSYSCDPDALGCSLNDDPLSYFNNYMNYTSCPTRIFSQGQGTRMIEELERGRPSLCYTIGCTTPCDENEFDFTLNHNNNILVTVGDDYLYDVNIIQGTYETLDWTLDGLFVEDQEQVTLNFTEFGNYTLCAVFNLEDCATKECIDIFAQGGTFLTCENDEDDCTPVNLLNNGNFSQSSEFNQPVVSYPANPHFDLVCNWYNRSGSPDYCSAIGRIGLDAINSVELTESIATTTELNLINNQQYQVIFDYNTVVTFESAVGIPSIEFGFEQDISIPGENQTIINGNYILVYTRLKTPSLSLDCI